MKPKDMRKALIITVISSVITALVYVASKYIPIFDILIVLGAQIPIALIYLKYGGKYAGVSTVVISILLILMLGPIFALKFLLTNAVVGFVIGYCGVKKYSGLITVGALWLATLLSTGILFKLLTLITGVDYITSSVDMVVKSFETSVATLKNAGLKSGMEVLDISSADFKSYILMAVPGMAIITSAITSYILYLITGKIVKRFGAKLQPIREFSKWYIPSRFAYPVMLMILLTMIMGADELSPISYAVRVIFMMLFTVNALSTCTYYLKQARFPVPLIWVILFTVFMLIPSIFVFVGLFEYALNFRALDPKRASIRRKK